MSITVNVRGQLASIDGWHWTSHDQPLENLLNSMLDPLGPEGSSPDPELDAANAACQALGGSIVADNRPQPPPFDPSVVY